MSVKVQKFGGTSLATADSVLRCKEIVENSKGIKVVIVSAPGKSAVHQSKVTDLLIDAHTQLCFHHESESLDKVIKRFESLSEELGVDIHREIARTRDEILIRRCDYDFVLSRGEYLMAVLFAKVMNYKFIDAANLISIKQNGKVDETATRENFSKLKLDTGIVVPGFYGTVRDKKGRVKIKTFTRGGSDYSGAIAAIALKASVYENYTDTHGVQSANPSIIPKTHSIPRIDYTTLYKLSMGGATVIYPSCLPILRKHNIPLKIDNTFNPNKALTVVTRAKNTTPYFSITYETRQNINKETVEVFAVLNRVHFCLNDLRATLKGKNVYLMNFKVSCNQTEIRIIATTANYKQVIKLLHDKLSKLVH